MSVASMSINPVLLSSDGMIAPSDPPVADDGGRGSPNRDAVIVMTVGSLAAAGLAIGMVMLGRYGGSTPEARGMPENAFRTVDPSVSNAPATPRHSAVPVSAEPPGADAVREAGEVASPAAATQGARPAAPATAESEPPSRAPAGVADGAGAAVPQAPPDEPAAAPDAHAMHESMLDPRLRRSVSFPGQLVRAT